MRVIGIHGTMLSGKSVAARALLEAIRLSSDNRQAPKVGYSSISSFMKKLASNATGIDIADNVEWVKDFDSWESMAEKDFSRDAKAMILSGIMKGITLGEFLQEFGRVMRDIKENIWISNAIDRMRGKCDILVLDGVRYASDVEYIYGIGGIVVSIQISQSISERFHPDKRDPKHISEVLFSDDDKSGLTPSYRLINSKIDESLFPNTNVESVLKFKYEIIERAAIKILCKSIMEDRTMLDDTMMTDILNTGCVK